jgi:succinate dehydrogenase / fumarate reductase iron-sulfur subunit
MGETRSNLQAFPPLESEVEGWDPEEEILVEPLPNFPVVRDLVVDMTRFFDALETVEPWLVPEGPDPEGMERLMDHDAVVRMERLVGCLLCALCSGSCPVMGSEQDFLGPAALAKARRFYEDPRDVRHDGIIELLDNEEGIRGCDLIFNCVKVCPRNVAPGGAIRKMRNDAEKLQNLRVKDV